MTRSNASSVPAATSSCMASARASGSIVSRAVRCSASISGDDTAAGVGEPGARPAQRRSSSTGRRGPVHTPSSVGTSWRTKKRSATSWAGGLDDVHRDAQLGEARPAGSRRSGPGCPGIGSSMSNVKPSAVAGLLEQLLGLVQVVGVEVGRRSPRRRPSSPSGRSASWPRRSRSRRRRRCPGGRWRSSRARRTSGSSNGGDGPVHVHLLVLHGRALSSSVQAVELGRPGSAPGRARPSRARRSAAR